MKGWGISPEQIRDRIKKIEWDNIENLKNLMLGNRSIPLKYSLRAPNGSQAIEDLIHLESFVNAWKNFTPNEFVYWQEVNFRNLYVQRLPTHIVIPNVKALVTFLGETAEQKHHHWELVIRPIISSYRELYPALINNLTLLDHLTQNDAEKIVGLLSFLKRGVGKEQYIRALPIQGLDTKFIENNIIIIESLMDSLSQGEVLNSGGLSSWLGCIPKPNNWITVRPLCMETKKAMGGFDCIRVPSIELVREGLPCKNLIIVENQESGLGLPQLADTIAVLGFGRNISWMDNKWIQSLKVAYWGDIDSWGFQILDLARGYCPNIVSLMMDEATIELHLDQMVREKKFISPETYHLNTEEKMVLQNLLDNRYIGTRLEQERLHQDFILNRLHQWLDINTL